MKNTLALLGLLAFLVLAVVFLMQRPGEQSVTESGGSELFEIDSVAVDRIEILTPSTSVVLEREGTEWMLREPLRDRADQPAVASLIHQAKTLRSKATVSTNPEKQSVFQVDSSGTLLKIQERGAEKAAMIIGKMGSSFSDVYLRIPPSSDVLLVDAELSSLTSKQVKDWRDRNITNLARESIKEVKFQFGDTAFVLALRDSVWMVGKDSTQDWVVNSLLSTLANFQADEFVDTPPSPAPRFTAFLSFAGLQLRFAQQKGTDKYFVQRSIPARWYEVQQWRAHQVLKRKNDLTRPRN